MVQLWLWIGVFSMTLGSIFFGIGAHNGKNQQWKILYTLNFFICLIAAGLYLAMALGQGVSVINGRPTYWLRFLTWFCSTPLLLLDLTFLGRTNILTTSSLLGANAYMIITGFAATISPKPISYIWYIVSCGAYVAIMYLLLKPYRTEAASKHPRSKSAFNKLVTVHLVLWTLYPVVWVLSPEALSVLNQGGEAMGYTLLDIASKVGFGFLSLNTLSTIEQAKESAPSRQMSYQ
jgi:sensory rhodopsin